MSSTSVRSSPLIEANPTEGVPERERRGWLFLVAIQVGTTICIPLFALGGQLGQHQALPELARNTLVSCAIITVLGMFSGMVGIKSRLPTALLVEHTFGSIGAKVVAAILLVTLFGWFGVQTEVLVQSISSVTEALYGSRPPTLLITLVSGLTMGVTAIIGAKALGKVAFLAVPLLLATMLVPAWQVLHGNLGQLLATQPKGEPYSFTKVISIIAGGHMLTVAVLPDVTRFLRGNRDNAIALFISFMIALPVLLLLSSALSIHYGSGDLIGIMIGAGVGIPALLVIFLATWTTNDKNLYESALAMSALLPGIARWKLTLLATILGTALATVGIFGHFVQLLIFLGIGIAPMIGVYLADFFLDRQRYAAVPDGTRVRAASWLSWLVGLALSLLTLPDGEGGLGVMWMTGVPALDGLITAAGCRCLFSMLQGRTVSSSS